jgi:hypothetical protein
MKTKKLDIKDVMNAIDTKNINWYNSLSDEEKSQVTPWQIMRFLSSVDHKNKELVEYYLEYTNELVNIDFNILRNHPELQIRLMQAIGIGMNVYHPWIPPTKKQKKDKIYEFLESVYTEYNTDEIEIIKSKSSKEDIIELAKLYGLNDKDITEIFK